MKERRVKQLIKKRIQHIQKYAAQAASTNDEEAIHQIRVGYKKLRAFIRLARLEPSAKKQLQIPSRLKEMYKHAGEVRNLQIYYRHIISFYKKTDIYPTSVLEQIEQARCTLFKVIKQFHFHKAIKHIEEQLPGQLTKKILEKFIRKKSEAINELLKTNMSDDNLHSVRKSLKDILYNLKPFHSDIQKYLPIAGKNDFQQLNDLSNTLNKHQEYVVDLSLVNTALSGDLSIHDKSILEHIKKRWEHRKYFLKESVFKGAVD